MEIRITNATNKILKEVKDRSALYAEVMLGDGVSAVKIHPNNLIGWFFSFDEMKFINRIESDKLILDYGFTEIKFVFDSSIMINK